VGAHVETQSIESQFKLTNRDGAVLMIPAESFANAKGIVNLKAELLQENWLVEGSEDVVPTLVVSSGRGCGGSSRSKL